MSSNTGGVPGPRRPSGAGTKFFYQFLTRPTMVGAIAPSSRHLGAAMLESIEFKPGLRLAEYGPGTGPFTDAILRRINGAGLGGVSFFAVERNQELADVLRGRFPDLRLVVDSVENIERVCREQGVENLDAIVSGLPWASFPEDLQRRILDATVRVLRPGGQLVTFAYQIGRYTRAGKRFAKLLPTYFSTVTQSRLVWRNVPPAYVLRCVR